MPRATECILNGKLLDINDAIDLRDNAKDRPSKAKHDFRCIECGAPVRPHKEGRSSSAHFEHEGRNPDCKLSHPARQ
jgi:hypothetical protein